MDGLWEISDNGDSYGYEREESGYYQEYKELFDELSGGAYELIEALQSHDLSENWNDMTVALLGETHQVLGYDMAEQDYFRILDYEENWAVQEAARHLERLSKADLIRCFRQVMVTLLIYFDIKAAHDCLTSIVQELDAKGALLERKNAAIDHLYQDLTGKNEADFDRLVATLPQRMWVE
jgi:hypothetical protein